MGEDSPMKDMQDTPNPTPKADLDYFKRYLDAEIVPGGKTLSVTTVVSLDKLKALITEVKALRTAVDCKDRVAEQKHKGFTAQEWEEESQVWFDKALERLKRICDLEGQLKNQDKRYADLEARNKDLEDRNKDLEDRNKHLGERCDDLEKRNYTLESSGSLYLGSPASYWGQLWEELYIKHQNLVTNGSEARKELEDRIKDLEAQLLGKFYRGQTALYWAERFEETLKDLQAARKSISDLNDIHGL